jgi:hypothetical protein
MAADVPLSAGTDATRVASYNPWVSLYWLVTGRTLAGLQIATPANRVDREAALRLWIESTSWFSNEQGRKGQIKAGQYADLAVPSSDMFAVPEDQIKDLHSSLTLVGGRIVWASDSFKPLAPAALPVSPSWSPVKTFGGYHDPGSNLAKRTATTGVESSALDRVSSLLCGCSKSCNVHGHEHANAWASPLPASDLRSFWGALGCSCFM